jgi:peptidoglycan/xylan/chitin deacetylase (PgdA/CDA1 family)
MLFNGIMNFAHERGIRYFYSPTADLIIANIDPKRAVQRDLFERVYDKTLTQYFPADRRGKWWVVDVEQNKERIVRPERRTIRLPCDKTICIFHDIERGLGHRRIDMKLATLANANAPATISAMLRTEKAANIKTTYNVVGSFFNEVRQDIEENGHCLAFHSYDHKIDHWWPISKLLSGKDQLDKLRDVDFHVRGFRPPQSRQTLEISDWRLCRYGFNWLASSLQKLRSCSPRVQNRLVKIPILLDDFLLYKKRIPFAYWEKTAIELIENNHFVTIGLHDCYAQFWQHHYISFLEKVKQYGVFKTFDQVADETFLSSGY